jgi:hypothetical protein
MCTFLRSQGLWQLSAGLDAHPTEMGPTEGTQAERAANATAISDWDKHNDMAIGYITLCVSPPIQEQIARLNDSSTVWNHLETKYGKSTPTTIYKDFKEVLSVRLLANNNPLPAIEKMAASFQCLSEVKVTVPEQIQAMMLLSALPQKWEMLVSIVTQQHDLNKIKFIDVRNAILTQF